MLTRRVLVVDDEAPVRALLCRMLEAEELEVVSAEDGERALAVLGAEGAAVALLDLNMPNLGGLDTLPRLHALDPHLPVIVLTGSLDVATAVRAMHLGAYDYLTKPFDHDDLVLTVRRALERRQLIARVDELRAQVDGGGSLHAQMGSSPAIQKVIQQVAQVAESTFTVLIQGETGTGKELVARAIHHLSARAAKPFVALDCGAIPETLIESELFGYERGAFTGADRRKEGHFHAAEGGTLFLDEVVNLPLTTQAKLLRVLQERQVWTLGGSRPVAVDVRIIAAGNVPLEAEARAGRFRLDLYYRLNEFTIQLPALRERREDIVELARRFIDEAAMELKRPVRGLSESAEALLLRHAWPGNVRELRNVIRRAVLLGGDVIGPAHLTALGAAPEAPAPVFLSAASATPLTLREARDRAVAEAERHAICEALRAAGGNKSEAARRLKTDYKTLHVKVKGYGLRPRDYVPD
jgi:two-component system nitrogen regulation response regulator GlnG